MKSIIFASTNPEKFQIAKNICAVNGIKVQQASLEIDEIQGEDPEAIVRDKVQRAYEQLGMPVVVSDDSWDIRALKGFPGAYMKSINYWFTPEDFLRLMDGLDDRHITLHQYLAYTDGNIIKVFSKDIEGKITDRPRGHSDRAPSMTVIELDSDGGKTIAEVFEQDSDVIAKRSTNRNDAWHDLIEWLSENL